MMLSQLRFRLINYQAQTISSLEKLEELYAKLSWLVWKIPENESCCVSVTRKWISPTKCVECVNIVAAVKKRHTLQMASEQCQINTGSKKGFFSISLKGAESKNQAGELKS